MMIALAVITGFIGLAKRGRGRKRSMGRYLRGTINEGGALGTLGAKVAVGTVFDETVNERTRVTSIEAIYTLSNYTPIALAGPILIGIAHSDYSDAEIEEWIETTGSWNEGDLVQLEVAGRKIRRIGVFDTPDAVTDSAVLNDGKPIKTKLNWILNQGQGLKQWAYNTGQVALATTDPIVSIDGHANLFPQ